MKKPERISLAMEIGFEPAYARQSDLLQMFADAVEKRTIEKCLQVLKARYMGDQNREDMEVKRCIKAIEEME